MKKVLNVILKVLLFIWQMPQEFVGFYMLVFYFGRQRINKMIPFESSMVFRIDRLKGGLSLSRFIYVDMLNYDLIRHEYGHSKQSMILGPLYLLVIGLPSLVWAWLYKDSWKKSYYWFYTERWADYLGGVKRKK